MGFSAKVDSLDNESNIVVWICKPNSNIDGDGKTGSLKNGYFAAEEGVKSDLDYNIPEGNDQPILIATEAGIYQLYWYKGNDDKNTVTLVDLVSGDSLTKYQFDGINSVSYQLEFDTSGKPAIIRVDS